MFFLCNPPHTPPGGPLLAILMFCLGIGLAGCTQSDGERPVAESTANPSDQTIHLATTTSWLECCLRELMGGQVTIVRLCPPGTCPGHFDMKPSAFRELQACHALFRFDFQSSLDTRLGDITSGRMRVFSIAAPEGLCLPGGYRDGLRQTHAALAGIFPEKQVSLDAALADAEARLTALESELRGMMANAGIQAEGLKVAASGHQAAFCRWLGLDPVVTYSGANATAPARIEEIVTQGHQAGIRYVISNRHESRQLGEALAWRFKAREISFSNFPRMDGSESTFGDLLRNNVAALASALGEDSPAGAHAAAARAGGGS